MALSPMFVTKNENGRDEAEAKKRRMPQGQWSRLFHFGQNHLISDLIINTRTCTSLFLPHILNIYVVLCLPGCVS